MDRHYEFCPKCDCGQNMTFSISFKPMVGTGRGGKSLLLNYHCEICNTFVKSVRFEDGDNTRKLVQAASIHA